MPRTSRPPKSRLRSLRPPATNLNSRGKRASLVAGAAVLALVSAFCALAWASRDAPEASADRSFPYPGGDWGDWYLPCVLLAAAAYVAGVLLVRRAPPSRRAAVVLAVAIQLTPLAAPLLLSSDAWTYWMYGRIAGVHGESPYDQPPEAFPHDPALPWTGPAWRDQTSLYGPAFTLASEPVAIASGESDAAAAWLFKAIAAAAMLTAALLAARLAVRKELALALAGWNPVLALHAAGGGHNDAWLGALVLAALALAASNRRRLAGAAWALAVLVKWVPLVFLVLRALEARNSGRRVSHAGFAVVFVAVAAVATALWGLSWLGAFGPLAENVDQATSYALPERLGLPGWAGVVAFAVAFAWLARQAWHGRARLGLAAGLLLVTTPYLTPWYLAWTVPLAAAEEDRAARMLAVLLTVYLAPQTIPT